MVFSYSFLYFPMLSYFFRRLIFFAALYTARDGLANKSPTAPHLHPERFISGTLCRDHLNGRTAGRLGDAPCSGSHPMKDMHEAQAKKSKAGARPVWGDLRHNNKILDLFVFLIFFLTGLFATYGFSGGASGRFFACF